MPGSLTAAELSVARELRGHGLSPAAAAVAVVMVTREHARPEPELVDILRQYQDLEDPRVSRHALSELKAKGWLIESQSYGQYTVHQAPDLRDKIATEVGSPEIANRLAALRSNLEAMITVVGSMNDTAVDDSFVEAIRSAQDEILLPMLATTPSLYIVPVLQERAAKGVRVRILLGSPQAVSRLRGATMKNMAKDAIEGWTKNARGLTTVEIRTTDRVDDLIIATCTAIDSRILRFDVYDPQRQRSLEGTMVQVQSQSGTHLNLVRLFEQHFETAWRRAKPVNRSPLMWFMARNWQWLAASICVAATVVLKDTPLAGITGSAAATIMLTAIVQSWNDIVAFFKRTL